jgi:hypothetical protein
MVVGGVWGVHVAGGPEPIHSGGIVDRCAELLMMVGTGPTNL